MQHYSVYGHHHFVLALGYMGSAIKKYIAELSQYEGNLRVDFTTREIYGQENSDGDFDVPNPPWIVDLIDTGVETMTGGRLQMLEHYLKDGTFMLTYGDGLSNVDIDKLTAFHKAHGRAATMTVVNPHTTFGHLQFDEEGRVLDFIEKPDTAKNLINGGFFVLEPRVFDIISDVTDATVMWEQAPASQADGDGRADGLSAPGLLVVLRSPRRQAAAGGDVVGGRTALGDLVRQGTCRQADRPFGRAGQAEVQDRRSGHRAG
jgi:glucose-1-phosphate cytidylyltransferase